MDFLTKFSIPVIVGICLCVGFMLKNVVSTEKINKFIPIIMGCLGLGLNIWINVDISPEIILEGLVSGLASTGLHQTFKKFLDNFKVDEKIDIEMEENDIPEE